MIIQARQAFKCQDVNLGTLELKYMEIRSNVDDGWKDNDFFKDLLADGLVIFFSDTADKTIEKGVQENAGKKEDKIVDTELARILDEAKAKAVHEAGQIATTQGLDKVKADKLQEKLIKEYVAKAKKEYETKDKQE